MDGFLLQYGTRLKCKSCEKNLVGDDVYSSRLGPNCKNCATKENAIVDMAWSELAVIANELIDALRNPPPDANLALSCTPTNILREAVNEFFNSPQGKEYIEKYVVKRDEPEPIGDWPPVPESKQSFPLELQSFFENLDVAIDIPNCDQLVAFFNAVNIKSSERTNWVRDEKRAYFMVCVARELDTHFDRSIFELAKEHCGLVVDYRYLLGLIHIKKMLCIFPMMVSPKQAIDQCNYPKRMKCSEDALNDDLY